MFLYLPNWLFHSVLNVFEIMTGFDKLYHSFTYELAYLQVSFQVMLYTYGIYDSFIVYAYALIESLAANRDPRDGRAIVKAMWNKTYRGKILNYIPGLY